MQSRLTAEEIVPATTYFRLRAEFGRLSDREGTERLKALGLLAQFEIDIAGCLLLPSMGPSGGLLGADSHLRAFRLRLSPARKQSGESNSTPGESMSQRATSQLNDPQQVAAFYEERYAGNYMDEWDTAKKSRVFELIRSLRLPDVGTALDFGCGNGVFTEVMRQALPPGWKVYGTDISKTAVDRARNRYQGCAFFLANDKEYRPERFDFLFSHHVLEHVYNLPQVIKEIAELTRTASIMLHVLPCGNEGSLEHCISLLHKDGVNPQLEDRFFFEDEGHLRRLTTEQLSAHFHDWGFVLGNALYSHQYHGALNWITRSHPSVLLLMSDATDAIDEDAKTQLKRLRKRLLLLWALRYPAALFESRLLLRRRTLRDYFLLMLSLPFYPFAKPMDMHLTRKALDEWNERRTERNGSEMYLVFKRQEFEAEQP